MMLQKVLKNVLMLSAVAWLSGCSSAVFPEVIEDDSMIASESGGKVIKEGDSLRSDEQNAAYEDMPDEDDVFADVMPAKDKKEAKANEDDKSQEADKDVAAKDEPIKPLVETAKNEQSQKADNVVEAKNEETAFEPSVTYRLETIYFDNGSAYVSPEYNAKIREAAGLVKNNNARITKWLTLRFQLNGLKMLPQHCVVLECRLKILLPRLFQIRLRLILR